MSQITNLANKVLFITGASRGIGREIALRAAKDGAKVAIAAKTDQPHPKLPGTIHSVAQEIQEAGGEALPCVVDVRDEVAVSKAVEQTRDRFGHLDILVNNASAISLTPTPATSMKTYDLMNNINTRGTYLCSKVCVPHLQESAKSGRNPHILNISPPLDMLPVWFKNHVAYTIAKFGMSMCVLGMAAEFRADGIAVNALWPRTAIWTAALNMLAGEDSRAGCRSPAIMADAAHLVLRQPAPQFSGKFLVDEAFLREAAGQTDFDQYAYDASKPLMLDFFVKENLEDPGMRAMMESVEANQQSRAAGSAASSSEASSSAGESGHVDQFFQKIGAQLNSEMVDKVKAKFIFEIDEGGDAPLLYLVDLKETANVQRVQSGAVEPDVTMKLKRDDLRPMLTGKLPATQAFMTGRLKIQGNMGAAMRLDGVLKQIGPKLE